MVKVKNKDESLNRNGTLIINDNSGKVMLNLVVIKSQMYLVAVKDVSIGISLSRNPTMVQQCIDENKLMEIKRKQRTYDNTPTNVIIAYAKDETIFINLKLNDKIYSCEPWIFRPPQCGKCGIMGHKIIECEKISQTCLRCNEDGHQAKNCKKNLKCILCSRRHVSYSKSCLTIKNELKKCNKTYFKMD
ncbi:unnamed protein product [Brachionus calyciflorus]|uniref:CCHC-type domain-containing protein n=1 Tax=Brachionus calyciflorus TaxID=104777 RepID=A0A814F3D1_9BILA|nr:unnamed protein product [Brachionus calyciflorus]